MDDRTRHIQLITRNLRILFKAVQAHSKTVETTCGLSSAQLWMLFEISRQPGVKVSQLAAILTIHPSTCSNMLDKLEAKGLICRDRSKKDQRSVHLIITRAGTELLASGPRPAQGILSGALEQLPAEQLDNLHLGLAGLIQVLQHRDDSAALIPLPGTGE